MKESLIGVFFAAVFSLILLFTADQVLGMAGFPTEPVLPVAHAPNFTSEVDNIEFRYTIRTNSRGIRYPEIPFLKDPGQRRVVVLGDSFTEGMGVEAENTFTSLLEKKFPGTLFINCGLIGAGPAQYARILQSIGFGYDPDSVLLILYANDIADTPITDEADLLTGEGWLVSRKSVKKMPARRGLKTRLHALIPRIYTLVNTTKNRFKNPEEDAPLIESVSAEARARGIPEAEIERWKKALDPKLVEEADKGRFDGYILAHGLIRKDIWTESLDLAGSQAGEKWRSAESMLSTIARLCRERGVPLAVVYAPAPFQYNPSYERLSEKLGVTFRQEWLSSESEFEKRIGRWADANKLPFLNLTPAFRKTQSSEPGRLHFKMDPHWTERGHELVATRLASWLKSGGWDEEPVE